MLTLSEFYPYFVLTAGFSAVFYFIGHVFAAFLRIRFENTTGDILGKNVLGMLTSVTLYALITSGGKTVFVASLPVSIFLMYSCFKAGSGTFLDNLKTFPKFQAKQIFAVVIAFLLIFGAKILKSVEPSYGYIQESFLEMDYCYYAQIADFMRLTGDENWHRGLNFWDEKFSGVTPYHYFEFWTCALWVDISGLNGVYVFSFSLAVYFLWLLFLAYFLILKKLSPAIHDIFLYAAAFFFLFVSAIPTQHFISVPSESFSRFAFHFLHGSHALPVMDIKRSLIELFFSLILLVGLYSPKKENFVLTLLMLPIYSVLLAPACLSLVFLYGLYMYMRKGQNTQYLHISLLAFVEGIMILLIFYLFSPQLSLNHTSVSAITGDIGTFGNFISIFCQNALRLLSNFIGVFLPFSFVVSLMILRKKFFPENHYILAIFTVGLVIAWIFGSLFNFFNWEQFFTTYAFPYFKIVFIVMGMAWFLNEFKRNFKAWFILVLIPLYAWFAFRTIRNMQLKIKLQTAHSAEQHTFFDKIKKKIVPMAELNTANNAIFYYSHENIKKLPFPSHYAIFGNADYLYYFVPNLQLANFCYEQFYELNGGNKFPNEIENSIKTAEINVFSKMKKSEGLNMDVISAKKAYIQEMRVKWAVVDKNAHVEPEIRAFFADSVENKATGQKIYILKSEK